MTPSGRIRATYGFRPVDHLVRTEFGIWETTIRRWESEGLPRDWAESNLFQYDEYWGGSSPVQLGWCEAPFYPAYERKVIGQEGPYEIVQDEAGRLVQVFAGDRDGLIYEYVAHPVTGWKDWEEEVAPRLDPATPERYQGKESEVEGLRVRQKEDRWFIAQNAVGGYMYLRSLLGPEGALFSFHDQPELVHAIMARWEALVGTALAWVQQFVELDEFAIGEDVCYKAGPLVSPRTLENFILPYYARVVSAARARQKRHLYFSVDSDGNLTQIIKPYMNAGVDVMLPIEMNAGNDVLEIARKYPELILRGGVGRAILAEGTKAIDDYLERVIPTMLERGGYIPHCDHGVPDNVSFKSYLHYRRRICEMDSA